MFSNRWIVLLLCLCLLGGTVVAKDKKATPVEDSAITVIETYVFNGHDMDKVSQTIRELVAKTRKVPGNLQYEAYEYIDHPRQVVFIERWVNEAAHEKHHKSPLFLKAQEILEPLLMYKPRIDRLQTYLAAPTYLNDHLGLYQVATVGSLARGVYSSDIPYSVVMHHGTQGVGTFKALDGEMIAVDGHFYRTDLNGKLTKVSPKAFSPFAEVIDFVPGQTIKLSDIANYAALDEFIFEQLDNPNKPVAIRIEGTFDTLKLRSVRKQTPPYSNLVKAIKQQSIFHLKKVKGTIVGFWFPAYWHGIAVTGFHLHFVNADRTIGGHVLGLTEANGTLALQTISHIKLQLPEDEAFAEADLSEEGLASEIHASEGTPTSEKFTGGRRWKMKEEDVMSLPKRELLP